LPDIRSVEGVAMGRDVINSQGNEIATPQLAVDGQVEESQIARAALQLQLGPDGPHMAWPQRRLRAWHLALVSRWSTVRW